MTVRGVVRILVLLFVNVFRGILIAVSVCNYVTRGDEDEGLS